MINTLFTAALKAEVVAHPDAVVLPGFPRIIQTDFESCGACCVQAILLYYGNRVPIQRLKRQLGTNEDGTGLEDIQKVLKRYRLTPKTLRKPGLRDLKASIDAGNPVLISLYEGEHWSICFGHSPTSVFVMNPSLDITEDGVGSLTCAVEKRKFRQVWDRWGVAVTTRYR